MYALSEVFFTIRTLVLHPRTPAFDVTFFHGDQCPPQFDGGAAFDPEKDYGRPLAPVLSYSGCGSARMRQQQLQRMMLPGRRRCLPRRGGLGVFE